MNLNYLLKVNDDYIAMSIKPYLTPVAIVIGFALVAGAIFFSDFGMAKPSELTPRAGAPTAQQPTPQIVTDARAFRAEERRIYGSPNAPITIVEFSDLECPFCARLHTTLKQVVDESNGSVNWEYRHLPLPMHQNALPAAIAAECVARLGGNDDFWVYLDVLLANIGSANPAFLKQEAGKLGLTAEGYDTCIADATTAAIVTADMDFLIERFGQQGTPFSLIVNNADDSAQVISGALPRPAWDQAIAAARSE